MLKHIIFNLSSATWVIKLKDLFIFSNPSQASLDACGAFKAGATREWKILCALFAHRSLAFRTFH